MINLPLFSTSPNFGVALSTSTHWLACHVSFNHFVVPLISEIKFLCSPSYVLYLLLLTLSVGSSGI